MENKRWRDVCRTIDGEMHGQPILFFVLPMHPYFCPPLCIYISAESTLVGSVRRSRRLASLGATVTASFIFFLVVVVYRTPYLWAFYTDIILVA